MILVIVLILFGGFFARACPEPREFDNRAGDAWLWRARDEIHD